MHDSTVRAHRPVAILLSTYQGAAFLREQLASLAAQTHADWVLYWRDDGSCDGSASIVAEFAQEVGAGRCRAVPGDRHVGITASFMVLLRAVPPGHVVAFADQDDVWLPDKLARGLAGIGDASSGRPALYCARQLLVDDALQTIGFSPSVRHLPHFPAALAQNLATGCTILLNPAAAALVAASRPPDDTLHDWWSYLMVGAAGGRLVADPVAVVLYRQHTQNAVGAPRSTLRRARLALRRGPDSFMRLFRHHVAALLDQPVPLPRQTLADLARIAAALDHGTPARLLALARLGRLVRRTWPETMLFRLWFLLG
ncbi:glycosyltransferase [Lichenicoccus roseus]|uniref:Glycosyltransferase n=1 Tax=Lichenicoccus roseus TaxID=2683649 RepID=A0A5R9J2D2_9PROT|nr:glycosyltransferase [Lichenicoccus roseus]TLU71784.1 glycosyltransferase [Lichenicoccus roseus]